MQKAFFNELSAELTNELLMTLKTNSNQSK